MAEVKVIIKRPFETVEQLSQVVQKIATDIQSKIVDLMRAPKTGRVYKTKAGRTRQRSAPGEAPAIDTGALVNSISQGLTFPTPTTALLSAPMEYAEFLEEGTDRMAARPYAGPAIKSVTEQLRGAGVLDII
jgi:hypothetical protein